VTARNPTADPAAARAALDALTQQTLGLSLPELLDADPEQVDQRAQTRLRHVETLRQTHLESVLRRAVDAPDRMRRAVDWCL